MADIFISYASEDRARVKLLAKAFEKNGWSVWWDRDLPFGRPFDELIRTELRAAGCVVALWTESAVKSLYVIGEARDALSLQKLISVFLFPCRAELPYDLQAIHGVELIDWDGDTSNADYQRLVRGITAILGQVSQKITKAEIEEGAEEGAKKEDAEAKPKINKLEQRIEAERKADEGKSKETETKIRPDKPEAANDKPSEPKPAETAAIERKSPKPRRTSNALKFGAVTGVIVLLGVGLRLYISKQTTSPIYPKSSITITSSLGIPGQAEFLGGDLIVYASTGSTVYRVGLVVASPRLGQLGVWTKSRGNELALTSSEDFEYNGKPHFLYVKRLTPKIVEIVIEEKHLKARTSPTPPITSSLGIPGQAEFLGGDLIVYASTGSTVHRVGLVVASPRLGQLGGWTKSRGNELALNSTKYFEYNGKPHFIHVKQLRPDKVTIVIEERH